MLCTVSALLEPAIAYVRLGLHIAEWWHSEVLQKLKRVILNLSKGNKYIFDLLK
jgi:hypothetical protein